MKAHNASFGLKKLTRETMSQALLVVMLNVCATLSGITIDLKLMGLYWNLLWGGSGPEMIEILTEIEGSSILGPISTSVLEKVQNKKNALTKKDHLRMAKWAFGSQLKTLSGGKIREMDYDKVDVEFCAILLDEWLEVFSFITC